jgi:hypothetical protein
MENVFETMTEREIYWVDALRIYDGLVGPCHQGIAGPQVADGGAVSNVKSSCEYIE